MKLSRSKIQSALTLVEMLMSISCGALLLAAVLTAGVALQRSFAAVQTYSTSEGDQLRVLDYIAMDCRRTVRGTVGAQATPLVDNGSWVNGAWVSNASGATTLILTVPSYYTSAGAVNSPTLTNGVVSYGTGTVTISYYQSGSNFNRQVIIQDSGGNVTSNTTTAIATNVASFTVTNVDLTSSLSCNIMFFPTFRYTTGGGTWRSGPSTPANSTGVDGDLYVIDPTASDPTTIGNVYRRAGGTYSLLENVKATTVYCNTFLRNAGARQ
jgi:hypothetical protein